MNPRVVELLRKIALFPDSPQYKGYNLTGYRMAVSNWSEEAKEILLKEGHEIEEWK